MADVVVFGADWCPDCRRSKRFLAEQRIAYDWVDLDRDPGAKAHVERLNGGAAIIPTIVFPDGSHLAEPTNEELADRLGLRRRAERDRYDLLILGGGPSGLPRRSTRRAKASTRCSSSEARSAGRRV